MDMLYPALIALSQVVVIDIVLAGDNAIVVGMAASQVPSELRKRVIFWGVVGAVALRVLFAIIATKLLAIVGLGFAGGILLLWVCWKMYREVVRPQHEPAKLGAKSSGRGKTSFWNALTLIIVADVSMSLDNVLAVAGVAKGNIWVLAAGLALSILLMAMVANLIARLLGRYHWITWIGLFVILRVALEMIWVGSHEVACQFVSKTVCDSSVIETFETFLGFR